MIPPKPIKGVFEFLSIYSRLEYALKRAGCIAATSGPQRDVILGDGRRATYRVTNPDWLAFAQRQKIQTVLRQLESTEAARYLRRDPPKVQVSVPVDADGKRFSQQWAIMITEDADMPFLLRAVQQVRHNLFHDGKWPDEFVLNGQRFLGGPIVPDRDERLLSAARIILDALVEADSDVYCHFTQHAY